MDFCALRFERPFSHAKAGDEVAVFDERFGDADDNIYSPDQTGDFAILWHAHPSVLHIRHEKMASSEIKLAAVKHEDLREGTEVTLILEPAKK